MSRSYQVWLHLGAIIFEAVHQQRIHLSFHFQGIWRAIWGS